ncbi:hypothetical protein KDL44_12815 [bacterium]|nr:hypothetical protein [bacterium]
MKRHALGILLPLLLLVSCGSNDNQLNSTSGGRDFSAVLLEDGLPEAPGSAALTLLQDGGRLSLELQDMHELRAAYVELRYDPQKWRYSEGEISGLPGGTATLDLIAELEPGVLQLGSILSRPQDSQAANGRHLLARLEFEPVEAGAMRDAASISAQAGAAPSLVLNGSSLEWFLYNPGDYDQNGLVSISDLTPLGINFGASGPFAEADVESVVDGDGNDEINISDISPIGASFGNSITGYSIFTSSDIADYPAANDAAPGNETNAMTVALADATGNSSADRLAFSASPALTGGNHYWVRATDGTDFGTPSNAVQASLTSSVLTIEHDSTGGPAPISGSGTSGNPYIVAEGVAFKLKATDSLAGDVTSSATYTVTGNPQVSSLGAGQIDVGLGDASAFSVSADEGGNSSNTLHYSVQVTPSSLVLSIDPASTTQALFGSGTAADPYAVNLGDMIQLRLQDAVDGDVTSHANTMYTVTSPAGDSIDANGLLSVDTMTLGAFTVEANYDGTASGSLTFRATINPAPLVRLDPSTPPVSGFGTGGNPYVVDPGSSYKLAMYDEFTDQTSEGSFSTDEPTKINLSADGSFTVDLAATGSFKGQGELDGRAAIPCVFVLSNAPKEYTFVVNNGGDVISGLGTMASPYVIKRGAVVGLTVNEVGGGSVTGSATFTISDTNQASESGGSMTILNTATQNSDFSISASVGGETAMPEFIYYTPVNRDPNVTFTASTLSGTAPLDVSFDASGTSDSDGSIAWSLWDITGDAVDDEVLDDVMPTATFLNAGTYDIRLRAADNDGSQDTHTVTITVSAGPAWAESYVISWGAKNVNMLDFSGAPGLVIDDFYWHDYFYGDSASGGTWTDVQNISAETDVEDFGEARMYMVDGRPAVIYSSVDNNLGMSQIKFLRATDAGGTAWGTPVVITTGNTWHDCDMVPTGGTGVAALYINGSARLACRVSSDSGASWGSETVIDNSIAVYETGLAATLYKGKPTAVWSGPSSLRWMSADDAQGSAWSGPYFTIVGEDQQFAIDIMETDDLVVSTLDARVALDNRARVLARQDNNAWIEVLSEGMSVKSVAPELAMMDGKPAVIFATPAGVRVNRSCDSRGFVWPASLEISTRSVNGVALQMIGGTWGVAVTDNIHATLKGTYYLGW